MDDLNIHSSISFEWSNRRHNRQGYSLPRIICHTRLAYMGGTIVQYRRTSFLQTKGRCKMRTLQDRIRCVDSHVNNINLKKEKDAVSNWSVNYWTVIRSQLLNKKGELKLRCGM